MTSSSIDEEVEQAIKDGFNQAGEEAMELASREAAEAVEEVANNIVNGTLKNQDIIMRSLDIAEGNINKNTVKETMNNILETDGPKVTENITSRLEKDKQNIESEGKAEAEAEAKKAREDKQSEEPDSTQEEVEQAGKDAASKVLKKEKYNYGKLSGNIFKFTVCAAAAIFMLKGFFKKLDVTFAVTKITITDNIVSFQVCDGTSFCTKDSFALSGFVKDGTCDFGTLLNGKTVTLTDPCGPVSIKVQLASLEATGLSSSTNTYSCNGNILGYMKCTPDMESNLFEATGESLDHIVDLAANAAGTAGDDLLNKLGLSGLMGSLKWIIIGAAIIFVLILVFWIYKQFKG